MDELTIATFFDSYAAKTKRQEAFTMKELAVRIATTSAPTKEQLPWIKFAIFGDVRSRKGSLRHAANMIAVTGVEIDYDGEKITFAEAVEILEKTGIETLAYPSPSHMRNGHGPRWRLLFRLSKKHPVETRVKFVSRVAGLFRDGNATAIAAESFANAQAYYFGGVGAPLPEVRFIEGLPLDHWSFDKLDETALGKPATKSTGPGDPGGPADEDALTELIVSGASFHTASLRLIGLWNRYGVSRDEAERRLHEIFD